MLCTVEPIVLWQAKWGLSFHIPWYLFLGGLAGGALTLSGLADLLGGRSPRLAHFARLAAWVTVPATVVGGLSLSLHLGKPERGFAFPLFFTNYRSWLTIGGWIVGLFAPVSFALALAWWAGAPARWRRSLSAAGVPLGLLMSLYTGFLLSGAWLIPGGRNYVPLWDSRYLPGLFVLSGVSTALAACGLGALIWDWRTTRVRSPRTPDRTAEVASLVDAGAIVAEGAWLYAFLSALAAGGLGQQLAYRLLTRGELAGWFWWGFVTLGLVAPLVAVALHEVGERWFHRRLRWLLGAKFVLVLAGGLVLRYVIIWGGDLKAPLPFPPSLWPVPLTGVLAPGG
jgi:protein NrfD